MSFLCHFPARAFCILSSPFPTKEKMRFLIRLLFLIPGVQDASPSCHKRAERGMINERRSPFTWRLPAACCSAGAVEPRGCSSGCSVQFTWDRNGSVSYVENIFHLSHLQSLHFL